MIERIVCDELNHRALNFFEGLHGLAEDVRHFLHQLIAFHQEIVAVTELGIPLIVLYQ